MIVWTLDAESELVTFIKASAIRKGPVEWGVIAERLGTTARSAYRKYQRLVETGRCMPILSQQSLNSRATEPNVQTEQDVKTVTTESGIESTAVGTKIKTLEDLLHHINADMTKYEVDKFEAAKWDGQIKGADKTPIITELHRVWVRLKPKAGPNVKEAVGEIIAAAFANRMPLGRTLTCLPRSDDMLNVLVVADPHIGKYSWHGETGHGDYDLGIASRLVRDAAGELMSGSKAPARRVIAVLGDYFHYDTPGGTTTKGTPLDRDGRVQKMIRQGAETLFDVINESAQTAPTSVIVIPGNHDLVLSWALQEILRAQFRNDAQVTINAEYTARKYFRWGKTLLGFAHGDTASKKLPALMTVERSKDWGETTYREVHRGHWHHQAAIETVEGVIMRTAPSLSPPDKWHVDEGFVGPVRAMESFYYHKSGRLIGMDVSAPILCSTPRASVE